MIMHSATLFSPAKINLFLAVTGIREDGYHDLISLAAPINFGDEIDIEIKTQEGIDFKCDHPDLPTDDGNLVVRAILSFQERTGRHDGLKVRLRKRIPVGAGLGGGSSNAAIVLLGLDQLFDTRLPEKELHSMASRIGSDCPLFLKEVPCLIRGRGEKINEIDQSARLRLQGRKLALFWPSFSISTAWAYGQFDEAVSAFSRQAESEEILLKWLQSDQPPETLLSNDFEEVLFQKFPAFHCLFNDLSQSIGVNCSITGSGSACFAFVDDACKANELKRIVRLAWGEKAGFEWIDLL
ncbi:MAG: 4-(cytidine 5'-diphospho)-2-C-methyl-D-erythritol kinase [Opitutae bacterium]|nr:4-(cytidine 5'-diphospho)-2-C-methyl-D-erythritol kinase [Opitutae bacterium]